MFKGIEGYFLAILIFFLAIAISFLLTKLLISYERHRSLAQPIHSLGVKAHKKKQGTPSMAGVMMYLTTLLLFLISGFEFFKESRLLALFFLVTSFFLIGLFDDLKKVRKKDEAGLRPLIRLVVEVIVSLITLLLLNYDQSFRWELILYPFDKSIFLGSFFLLLLILSIVGTSNANNLLDGLDGLSGGVSVIAITPFLLLALKDGQYYLAFYLLLLSGSIIGFLFLNVKPAKIFMGDSGSLFIGSSLAISAILLNRLILLPLVCLIYVVETLSVIMQVVYYKFTKRRIFLMAPLHHHFELKKVPESKIVMLYYLVELAIMIVIIIMEVII